MFDEFFPTHYASIQWADMSSYRSERVFITAQKRGTAHRIQCDDCSQRCRDFLHAVAHECIPGRAFQCDACCANFRRASQLERHVKSHDLSYACTKCLRRYCWDNVDKHTPEECKKQLRKHAPEMDDYAVSNLWFAV